MARRRKEPEQTAKQRVRAQYRQSREFAQTIREKWPNVARMRLSYDMLLDEGSPFPDSPHPGEKIFVAEDKALIWFECSSRDCIDGSHDITDVITSAIDEGKSLFSGTDICQGWQDSRRVGQFRCLCRLQYTMEIEYRKPAAAQELE